MGSIVAGVVLIILGATGQFALEGTGSSLALVGFGCATLIYGFWKVNQQDKLTERAQQAVNEELRVRQIVAVREYVRRFPERSEECRACGKMMPSEAKYCIYCNARLREASPNRGYAAAGDASASTVSGGRFSGRITLDCGHDFPIVLPTAPAVGESRHCSQCDKERTISGISS